MEFAQVAVGYDPLTPKLNVLSPPVLFHCVIIIIIIIITIVVVVIIIIIISPHHHVVYPFVEQFKSQSFRSHLNVIPRSLIRVVCGFVSLHLHGLL
jgi:hypothetical protein